ncbi:MAG: hypothetical protein E7632_11610 [Ruminococcaceae bacterium]|nr:hypothetical protein [Oscillospiraceae bacterium]
MKGKNKQNFSKSVLALILAQLILLASCGQEASSDDTTATTGSVTGESTDAVAEQPHYLTLEADFGGKTFTMLGVASKEHPFFQNFEIYVEEENGDVVNDAVFQRNQIIEEKYNVTIKQDLVETPNAANNTAIFKRIQTEIMTNDKTFDAFFIPSRDAALVMQSDYCANLLDIDSIDMTESYWNQVMAEALTINDELLLASSDFSLVDKKRTYIVSYNRELLSTLSDADLPDMVREGTWTFDNFNKLASLASRDLDGNGEYDWKDQWGIGMGAQNDVALFYAAMGGRVVEADKDGTPIIVADNERNTNIAEIIYRAFMETQTTAFNAKQNRVQTWIGSGCPVAAPTSVASYLFQNGRSLFSCAVVQSLPSYSDVEGLDYGIVPFPKYDEQQKDYYTLFETWGALLMGIPVTSDDPEFPGFMLEVLSGYSTDTSYKAYVETASKIKYIYDEDSAEMLDIVYKGLMVDVGVMYNFGGIFNPIADLMLAPSFNYASRYAAIKDAAQAAMDEVYGG